MRPSRASIAVPCILVVAWGAFHGAARPSRPQATAPASGPYTSASHPLSCKPTPPFVVVLQPAGAGAWSVEVTAREAASAVRVAAGAEGSVEREIWRGDMGAGEVRRFRISLPAGAGQVWASAGLESPGAVQRSHAVAATRAEVAADGAGRLVTDPQTGESVYEYTGQMGTAP